MSLGEILRNKREELELTLDEVSGKVGFSKPYLSTIETGKVNNPPSDELLKKLEKVLGFEPGLLLYIAHIERMAPDVREKFETSEAENKKWRRILRDLLKNKSDVKHLDKLVGKDELEQKGTGAQLSPGRLVPIINKVQAGYPADFDDLDYPVGVADDYIRCPDLHDPNAFAVCVVGDSMEPNFKEGDIVVFSPQAEVSSGDDCFIRFASPHETTFKRVFFEPNNMVRLQPRNDKYAPMMVEGKRINGLYRAIAKYERL
ncbi:MAG: XRE family transcriptional regulator [Planctomycetota bacterium]